MPDNCASNPLLMVIDKICHKNHENGRQFWNSIFYKSILWYFTKKSIHFRADKNWHVLALRNSKDCSPTSWSMQKDDKIWPTWSQSTQLFHQQVIFKFYPYSTKILSFFNIFTSKCTTNESHQRLCLQPFRWWATVRCCSFWRWLRGISPSCPAGKIIGAWTEK